MRFSDLFVPRWQHSNPDVRIRAIGRIEDTKLLSEMAASDESDRVRRAAEKRLNELKGEKVTVSI